MVKEIKTKDYKGKDRRDKPYMNGWKVAQVLVNILVALLVYLSTGLIEKVNRHDISIELLLEADKATTEMVAEFHTTLNNINKNLNKIALQMAKLPPEYPPLWWKEEVRGHLAEHDQEIKDLQNCATGCEPLKRTAWQKK